MMTLFRVYLCKERNIGSNVIYENSLTKKTERENLEQIRSETKRKY